MEIVLLRTTIASLVFAFPCLGTDNSNSIETIKISPSTLSSVVPYDYEQHETHQFIEKTRQTGTVVQNNYTSPIKLEFKVQRNNVLYTILQEIPAEKKITLGLDEILLKVQFSESTSNLFFKVMEEGKNYTLSVGDTYVPYRPKFVEYYNFKPKFFNPSFAEKSSLLSDYGPQYSINPPTNLEDKFKEQYDNHLNYLISVIFHQEGINPETYFTKLNYLYNEKNYPPHLFNLNLVKPQTLKIPKKIHCIWLTHNDKPVEFCDKYIDYTLESIKACTPKAGYKHYLWVINKENLPETVNKLANASIKIKEIKDLGDFELINEFYLAVKNKQFGKASDILRLEILLKKGGAYRDTDLRIHQSLDPFLINDGVFNNEPMSEFAGNAFIVVKPNHPVIKEAIRLIKRNYNPFEGKKYINNIPESDGYRTILITGPGIFTVAVANAIDQSDNIDVVLPPAYFYPTPTDSHPQLRVVKPNEPLPVTAFASHYWDTSWVAKENGSVG